MKTSILYLAVILGSGSIAWADPDTDAGQSNPMKMKNATAAAATRGEISPMGPSITVYNQDFGVVRDRVPLELVAGINEVSYSGVTSQLEPESVVLRDPAGEVGLRILEQSYRGDPVDQMRLLQMFEGETIEFLKVIGDREVLVEGRIIRAPSAAMTRSGNASGQLEPIIEVDGQLMTALPGAPRFPGLGDDSILQPTLSWKLHAAEAVALDAELSYLTGGMSWRSDYNLVLPEEGNVVTLTGWVSVENHTGTGFENARLKLIAGDVNKVVEPVRMMARSGAMELAMDAAPPPPEVEARKFDEFHMYTLPLATTLRDRETKQVEFTRAEAVETRKIYVYEGSGMRFYGGLNTNVNFGAKGGSDVAIYREFDNTEENGLGIALPAGRIRFYRMDRDGQMEFTGEDEIDHSPKNETIRVYLGNAYDLVGERTRANFYKHPSRDMLRESFAIEVRNRGESPVTVEVIEPLYRWSNWEIVETDRAFEKIDAQTVRFTLEVEPDGIESVEYTVEYTW